MYWFVFGVLLINLSICYFAKRDFKFLYYISIIILTLFLCFRYGQGTDYFAYWYIFEQAPDTFQFQNWYYTDQMHGEIGWKFLCNVFRILGFSFFSFAAFVGLLSMISIHLFICKMCPERNLALLLIFPTLYLTYFFSGMRQGLAISLFLGFVLKYLFQKRYKMYILGVLLCMSFHFTAAIYIVPLIVVLLNIRPNTMWLFFYLCIAGGIVLALPVTQSFIYQLPISGNALIYMRGGSVFWPAVLERIAMLGFVLAVYFLCKNQDRSLFVEWIMVVYIFSASMSILFFWASILTRLFYPLKLFEIILLSMLVPKLTRWRGFAYLVIVLFSCVMLYKNIDSYINQAGYIGVSAINYPYISIFNQEDLYQYRIEFAGQLWQLLEQR